MRLSKQQAALTHRGDLFVSLLEVLQVVLMILPESEPPRPSSYLHACPVAGPFPPVTNSPFPCQGGGVLGAGFRQEAWHCQVVHALQRFLLRAGVLLWWESPFPGSRALM